MIRLKAGLAAAMGMAVAMAFTPSTVHAQAESGEIVPDQPLAEVPREDTLILGWSILQTALGVTNPWSLPAYTHQNGNGFSWEPLMYFGIFSDQEIPWLANSMEYTNDDFTALRIELNPDAKWSDGEPVTAEDVVFTFDGQMQYNVLKHHENFNQFVESYEAVDDHTVDVTFKIPAPRFKFQVLTQKFDTGISILPKHGFDGIEDATQYAGGTEIPHSGPYKTVAWNANQRIMDLRDDWWAAESGLNKLPDVKRIVIVNLGGTVGQSMDVVAQRLVNNEMDSALDMRSSVIGNILAQNPVITTHTGDSSPYGYLDWWPNSLWMNTKLEPFDDPRVRRAASLLINRELINELLYEGAEIATIFPFPLYPGIVNFVESDDVQALIEELDPGRYDPDESARLMEEAGFTLNGDDLWERDGETINASIAGFEGIHSDIVPILVEMLRNGGFEASINFGADALQQMSDGAPGFYMFGHGASLKDPYTTLELYHSRFSAPVGASSGVGRFSRYDNPEFDAILDQMAPLSAEDEGFHELAVQALEIYWRDQIDIPIIQWLHRIAYNQTYWTNWPTDENLGLGMNGAFWAFTGMPMIANLESTGGN
ncbi:ABC transporter substrate-binding protein [Bauldia sp.]|uniref:ABC transporter substrate-binding protein n=1 Tax=Bauldia sp. TaxID=2575872 RepID=UPI003BADB75D